MDDRQASAAAQDRPEPSKVKLAQRLEAAKAALGANYVLHPQYRHNPRHSLNPEIYGPARAAFLAAIASSASSARAKNTMWQLANRVRTAVAPLPQVEHGPAFLRRVG